MVLIVQVQCTPSFLNSLFLDPYGSSGHLYNSDTKFLSVHCAKINIDTKPY